MDAGNIALNGIIQLTGAGGIEVGVGNSSFAGPTQFTGTIRDASGSAGVAGYLLSSTGTSISWIAPQAYGTLTQVLNAGNNGGGNNITNIGITTTENLVINTGTIKAGGSTGALYQLMQSTATGVEWVSSVNLATVETDNLIISGGTITAGGVAGTAGQVLSSTVTGVEWVAAGSGSGGLTHVVKTTNYTAADGDMVGCRISAAAYTISPPSTPTTGMKFGVQDISNNAAAFNITIDFNTQGTKWNTQATDLVLSKNSFCAIFEYISVSYGWALIGGGIQ